MIVYGIKNCNTVKSALDWLKKNNKDFEFHDYKSKGVSQEKLRDWCAQVGWEKLVNKKGTTWRQLPPEVQSSVINEQSAIELMSDKTSVIRQPLVEQNGKVLLLGFDESLYQKTL